MRAAASVAGQHTANSSGSAPGPGRASRLAVGDHAAQVTSSSGRHPRLRGGLGGGSNARSSEAAWRPMMARMVSPRAGGPSVRPRMWLRAGPWPSACTPRNRPRPASPTRTRPGTTRALDLVDLTGYRAGAPGAAAGRRGDALRRPTGCRCGSSGRLVIRTRDALLGVLHIPVGSLQRILRELPCPCVGGHLAPPPANSGRLRRDSDAVNGRKAPGELVSPLVAPSLTGRCLARRRYPNQKRSRRKGAGQRHLPIVVPGRTAMGKPRLSAAAGGHPAQKLEAGFFVEP
jgi:hypothetical protein